MRDLALAVLAGLAFYGVVNLVGDLSDFIERRRRPLRSVHDFEVHRRALRTPRRVR